MTTKKNTDELLKELKSTDSFQRYAEDNSDSFQTTSLAEELSRIMKERNLKKSRVFRAAEISEIYGYQILSGTKRPDRGKVLQLSLSIGLSVDETQKLLKLGGYAPLYVRNEQDAAVIYGLTNGLSVLDVNGLLYEKGLSLLT